jgi:hypothetical protein
MTVLLVLTALAACGFLLDRLSAAPAARGVSVSARLAEARRLLDESGVSRSPREQKTPERRGLVRTR